MGKLTDEDGVELKTQQEKLQAFQKHNLVSTPSQENAPVIVQTPVIYRKAGEEAFRHIQEAPGKTKNNSSPGPDRITYRLIKFINDTELGQYLLHDLARSAEGSEPPIHEPKGLMMVMIPKPSKDLSKLKGWRPIVLANTIGKLCDKVVANRLQRHPELMHQLQYGSRKGRSATDAMMIIIIVTRKELGKGNKVSLLHHLSLQQP